MKLIGKAIEGGGGEVSFSLFFSPLRVSSRVMWIQVPREGFQRRRKEKH